MEAQVELVRVPKQQNIARLNIANHIIVIQNAILHRYIARDSLNGDELHVDKITNITSRLRFYPVVAHIVRLEALRLNRGQNLIPGDHNTR